MAIELIGNWSKGLAFDVHTLDSVYLGTDDRGHDQWKTTRSEMGELVYQLKYQGKTGCVPRIIELLRRFKGIETFDAIVPIPRTNPSRGHEPVTLIAQALGRDRGVKVLPNLLVKQKGGPELKNVGDPDERRVLLRQSMALSGEYNVAGLKVLLVDDLFRSGATLAAATDLLLNEGGAAIVCVITMTRTRSKR